MPRRFRGPPSLAVRHVEIPLTVGALALLVPFSPAPLAAVDPDWSEILHLQDGRTHDAPALDAYWTGPLHLAWTWQSASTDSVRQVAAGITFGLEWVFRDLGPAAAVRELPDVGADSSGSVVVWREEVAPGEWQILGATAVDSTYSAPIALTSDPTVKSEPAVAAGPHGIYHVAYATLAPGPDPGEIVYLGWDPVADSTWSVAVTDDAALDDQVAIAVDRTGVVWLAWRSGAGTTGALGCAKGNGGGFLDVPTGVTANAKRPSLDVDRDGKAHVAYAHETGGGVRIARYLPPDGGGGFAAPLDASPSDALYGAVALTVSEVGDPFVAYRSNSPGTEGVWVAEMATVGSFDPPSRVLSDPTVTYGRLDLQWIPITVGLPGSRTAGFGVVHVASIETSLDAGTPRSDLRLHRSVYGTDAPEIGPSVGRGDLRLASRPSPFEARTTISFELPAPAHRARLEVFDVAGRRVATLRDGPAAEGPHRVAWTPGDATAPGVYWVRLSVDGRSESVASVRRR